MTTAVVLAGRECVVVLVSSWRAEVAGGGARSARSKQTSTPVSVKKIRPPPFVLLVVVTVHGYRQMLFF